MRKNPKFFPHALIFLILCLPLLTCKQNKERVSFDLIENFSVADKIGETRSLDFREDKTLKFLGRGWSKAPKGGVWANSLLSELRFYTFFPDEDHRGVFTCVPFSFPQAPQQTIDLYLNGNRLAHFSLEKRKRQYSFQLPGRYIQNGDNILGFKFLYAVSPREGLGKKDPKKRAARFESLAFSSKIAKTGLIQRKGKAVLIPAFTRLDYYLRIPERSSLDWAWKFVLPEHKKSGADVMIGVLLTEKKGGEESLFQDSYDSASSKKKSSVIDLERFSGKVVRLSFVCQGVSGLDETVQPAVSLDKAVIRQKRNISQRELIATKSVLDCEGLDEANILLIVLDAANPSRMSCYGYERETTPVIDRIADDGILFSRAYAQASWTVPSIASLFTSTVPITHKVWNRNRLLSDKAYTLAEALKERNFQTCALTATSSASSLHNLLQGFDRQMELYKWAPERLKSGKRLGVVWAEDFISPAEEWIQKNRNKKFFMYMHYIQPHTPYNPPSPFREAFVKEYSGSVKIRRPIAPNFMDKKALNQSDRLFIDAMYDSNLKYVDFQLGEILEFLKKSGVYDNTMIFITADHGEAFLEHGEFGHSSSLYEEEIRIPLIVKFPERCGLKGIRLEALVQSIDIMATLLDIQGMTERTKSLQGKSLIPLLSGAGGEINRFIFASLSSASEEDGTKADALSDGKYKLISQKGGYLFFDLAEDPGEKRNIFFDRPILARFYQKLLTRFKEDAESQKDLSEKGISPLDETTKKHLKALGYIK